MWWALGLCPVHRMVGEVRGAVVSFLALAVGGVFLSAYRFPLVGAVVYLSLLLIHLPLEGAERASVTDEDSLARRKSETSGHRGIDHVRAGDLAEGPSPRVERSTAAQAGPGWPVIDANP